MARTREMIRSLRSDLFYRLRRLDQVRDHNCYTFFQATTECALCALVARGRLYSLALGQFLREAGLIPREFFVEEITLIGVVGEEKYKRMVEAETRAFMFGPIVSCPNCTGKFKWLTTREALRDVFPNGQGTMPFYCPNCNHRMLASATDMDIARLLNRKPRKRDKHKRKENLQAATKKLRELFIQVKNN